MRHYARDRQIDIQHLALNIIPDFRRRTIAGEVTLRFRPIAQRLSELRLDAVDLTVTNLACTEKLLGWQVTTDQVIVTFAEPIPIAKETTLTLRYHAQPAKGLYFRTREMGYPAADEHLWTQGEAIQSRHWFPCLDAPNLKFTSEVTCRVPEDMVVLSNGRKVSDENAAGLRTVRWAQEKPHANYLITLIAGHFKKIEDHHGQLPLAFWTVPSEFPQAASSFAGTRDIMEFLEREIGVPYPWAKYDQVCVEDFTHGGMENTSLTTLTSATLHTKDSETLRDSRSLVAHELAHQWFGDLVTCKDWSETWLNEGFATYYDHLYDEHHSGRDQFLYRMWQAAQTITGQTADARPMISRAYDQPMDLFNWRTYGKGAWTLHMLRHQLGPDVFRRCIKTFLERHQFGNVATSDLMKVLEATGHNFDQFFDQWSNRTGTPVLDVDYQWDERTKLARLTIKQTQPVNEQSPLFTLPLTIRFRTKSSTIDRVITVKDRSEDFYFNLPQAPEIVRLDPELALLAKINFRPPPALLDAQIADRTDVVGRLHAVEPLQSRADHDSIAKLKDLLNGDGFWGVRVEASKALRAIHTNEALDALLASTHQGDARARRQVVSDIGGFYRESAYAQLLHVLKTEDNPDILSEVLPALAAYPKPEVRELLQKYLRSHSYHNVLADAAIRAMRAQDDPLFIAPLLETLRAREPEFTSRTFATGLETLAWLARTQTNPAPIREFIAPAVNHPRKTIQLAALNALGTLGDTRALPLLETFARAAKDSPERQAAEKSIEALRSARKPSAELGQMRQELLDLQKDNRQLRQDLDAFKKKLEAAPPTKPGKK